MADAVADRLSTCRTLDEFYDVCAQLGIYGSGRRFIQLELDITNRCNIRCVMCYWSYESTARVATAHMAPETFAQIASAVLPHAHRLSLSLGNEPLMSPHFVSILQLVAPHQIPHVNFFTNGLLLNDVNIDAIVGCGVTQVCVSIDGATARTYSAIRRGGDFDLLLRNVERLITRRNTVRSATPRVRFDIVLMQRNIHELVDIVNLGARLGAQQLCLRHVVAFEGLGMEQESLRHTQALSNYWLERALARAAELGMEVQTRPEPFDLTDNDVTRDTPAATPYQTTPYCPYPFFHIAMGPGGHVHACPNSHGEEPYGQVSAAETLEQVWLGPKFTSLRRRILE